jgi:hypothetical protein
MTTDISAGDITFGRKTQVIAEMLRQDWSDGRRALVAERTRAAVRDVFPRTVTLRRARCHTSASTISDRRTRRA